MALLTASQNGPRPPGRLIRFPPVAVKETKLGILPLDSVTGKRWWTNGDAAWSEDVLDPASKDLLDTKSKVMKDPFPVDAFWPRNPRLKLEFVATSLVYGLRIMVYRNGDVIRFVSAYVRPPKFLWASRRAALNPILFEEKEGDPRAIRVGRLRPSEDLRNEALVDDPDPAKATMLVMPRELPKDQVDAILVDLGLAEAPNPDAVGLSDTERERAEDLRQMQEQRAQDAEERARSIEERRQPKVIEVADYKIPLLKKTIARFKKAADRLGVQPPVIEILGDVLMPTYGEDGEVVQGRMIPGKKVQITVPEILKLPGDFQVLAKIEQVAPGNNIVHPLTQDAVSLPQDLWSMDMRCDHCGKVRRRSATYLVEDQSNGERKHIGSACLNDFTGHPATEQLCKLAGEYAKNLGDVEDLILADQEGEESLRKAAYVFDPLDFLAVTAAVIRKDGKFISRTAAMGSNQVSTADTVLGLYGDKKTNLTMLVTESDKKLAAEALEWAKTFHALSEYDFNIQALAKLSFVTPKHAGFFSSILSAYSRANTRSVERENKKEFSPNAPGGPAHTGYPEGVKAGDRIKIKARLDFTHEFDTQFGRKYLYKFIDEKGNVYKWMTGSAASLVADFEDMRAMALKELDDLIATRLDRDWEGDKVKVGWYTADEAEEFAKRFADLIERPGRDRSQPYDYNKTDYFTSRSQRQQVGHFSEDRDDGKWHLRALNPTTNQFEETRRLTNEEMVEVLRSTPYASLPEDVKREIDSSLDNAQSNYYGDLFVDPEVFRKELMKPEKKMKPVARRFISDAGREHQHRPPTKGDWYEVTASVKELGVYKGSPETELLRVKLRKIAAPVSARADLVAAALEEVGVAEEVRVLVEEAAAALAADTSTSAIPTTDPLPMLRMPRRARVHAALSNFLPSTPTRYFPPHLMIGDAAQRAIQAGADRNDATILLIPVPGNYAQRFPDPTSYNHGHQPHITLCFVGAGDFSKGQEQTVLQIVRKACRRLPPFRVIADHNSGLHDFGDGESGEKALWFPVRSEPRGELERLHRTLRRALEAEDVEVQHHAEFVPHITWSYVPNTLPSDERRRIDGLVADRFRDGFAWDVKQIVLSGPSGEKAIMLNPTMPYGAPHKKAKSDDGASL